MIFSNKKVLLSFFVMFFLYCNVLAVMAQPIKVEHIVNGNFEDGNADFSTEYTFSPGDIWGGGEYDIVSDPKNSHSLLTSFGDHTSGSGLMMAVNGATDPLKTVWSQNVSITPDTDYTFSVWFAIAHPAVPAELQVLINGISVGMLVPSSIPGTWTQFKTTWNSGVDTSAVIEIVDLNTVAPGNDFAIDDISLSSGLTVDCDPCDNWKNHGQYVSCVSNAVNDLVESGYLTEAEGDDLIGASAKSDIGKKGYTDPVCSCSL